MTSRRPTRQASARLFKAGEYRRDARGPDALQINGKPFAFGRLMPGDHLVAFHAEEDANTANPFPTTFHASASSASVATVIHVAPGQRVLDANIQLPSASPMRKLRIAFDWNGHDRALYGTPFFFRRSGSLADVTYLSQDVAEIDLVTSAIYEIRAHAPCRSRLLSLLDSDPVTVDGADSLMSQVTLTFTSGGCPSEVRK